MTINAEEKRRRQGIIDFARGSCRFEGIHLDEHIEAINQRYINGEIEMKEHTQLVLAYARQLKEGGAAGMAA